MITRRRSVVGAVLGLSLVLVPTLTACDSDSPAPTDPTASAPSEDPTVEPTTEPTSDPEPSTDPEDLEYDAEGNPVISTRGVGPLRIGVSPTTNPGEHMIRFVENLCYSEEMGITTGNLDRWVSAEADPPGSMRPFTLAVDDMSISRIDVFEPSWKTARGIGIGSTLEALQAAYPEIVEGPAGPTSRLWLLSDDDGTIAIETQTSADAGSLLPAGVSEGVTLIRVLRYDIPVDWHAANSGNIAGTCF